MPAAITACGTALAMASITSSACAVRKVISSTFSPPSTRASASGTASSTRSTTSTGITGLSNSSSCNWSGVGRFLSGMECSREEDGSEGRAEGVGALLGTGHAGTQAAEQFAAAIDGSFTR